MLPQPLEPGFTQLIKTGGLAPGSRRDDVPNLHVAVVDQHAIDQEFHQGPLLRKCGLSSSAPDTLTKRFDRRHHACQLFLPIALRLQLRFLGCQGVLFLFEVVAPPLILGEGDHLPQIRLSSAIELSGSPRLRVA